MSRTTRRSEKLSEKQPQPADRYLKVVEWSDEDQCYIGRCPGLMLGGVHGDDETQVYQELVAAVQHWIDLAEQDRRPLPKPDIGRQYSGKFVLRVGEGLHEELALRAAQAGLSLNHYCRSLLDQALHQ